MPHDPARKRLSEIIFDPKALAAVFASAVAAILFVLSLVFDLWDKLPDAIKSGATTEQQRTAILLALAAIVAFLVWVLCGIVISLWEFFWERRRHPDGKPKPGKVAIYVAELRGDDKEGSHRNHILLSLRQQLGASVQVLRAGIELRVEEKGDPEDDARGANRKGQKYLDRGKHRGDLLIWGQILQESKLVELRFTSRAHDGAEQRRFNLTEKMLLAPDFGPEMAAALAAIAAQLALPAMNPGKYVADVLIPMGHKFALLANHFPVSMGPDERGMLLHYYALAERTIGEQRGDSDALIRAIRAYRAALGERTRERVPLDWATTQNSLGNALWTLGERECGTARLEEAVDAYRAALEERTRERVRLDWATTQNNLGLALLELGSREIGTARLEEAVQACRAALDVWKREGDPLLRATAQNNLGKALRALGERQNSAPLLEEAVDACRAALKERPRKRVPLYWALTQNNLGNALQTLGERESGTERLEAAVAAYRKALKEFTREKVPLDWAMAQNNLGNALSRLGERESGTKRLEAAVAAYRAALKERTRENVPLQWAMTQDNLGNALASMRKLGEAAESFRSALQVLTPENHLTLFTSATDNLARVLEELRAGKDGELPGAVEESLHEP